MRAPLLASLALASLIAGCIASTQGEQSSQTESSIRAMTAQEILGEIAYGESKDVNFTPSPKYRAYSFRGERGDSIEATVVAQDGTDPILWLTDEAFNTIAVSNDPKPTERNPLIARQLLKTGKFFLVFREMNFAPRAKFVVTVKKTGAVPLACDPDGEGSPNPECVTPLGFDPFETASCAGPAITTADAAAKFSGDAGVFPLENSKVYYRSRQCTITAGAPSCTNWVRVPSMDITLASVAAAAAPATNTWSLLAATARAKVKIDFTLEPGALKQFCVDGPFATLRNDTVWTKFEDGTPGLCGASLRTTPTVTATCARFEPETIELSSGDPTYYTEYAAVLLARY